MKTITLDDTTCVLRVFTYLKTKALCIRAYDIEDNAPYAELTANIPDHWKEINETLAYPQSPIIILKNYSENEGYAEQLAAQGFIDSHNVIPYTGDMFIEARISAEWQKELNLNK